MRPTGFLAGAALATVTAPAASAEGAAPAEVAVSAEGAALAVSGGPSGVAAPEAAIESAANGALLWSRELNTSGRWPASPR